VESINRRISVQANMDINSRACSKKDWGHAGLVSTGP
jgi:hypothetical protein